MFESGYIRIAIIALYQKSKHKIGCTAKSTEQQHNAEGHSAESQPRQSLAANSIKVTLSTISLGESILCKCFINNYFELQEMIKVFSMFESGYIQIIRDALYKKSKHLIGYTAESTVQ